MFLLTEETLETYS